ncbi:hypothetical protein A1O7_07421 [Cladophialophora yegresii CBS 114405]|uniref:Transcription factor domain-containing protein n=1 Tax=Cladophialophora yegresii CBS 114405 TaxID=1182544 RepID=W9VMY4_9EURO|nr:uncharacterized protein A1O7_07421 [Cladophialophora yegresii CBS 114405]EXJ57077.1 hypothetical protein A1O7_07421 [Cladophialophora yegresii CBS 114405]
MGNLPPTKGSRLGKDLAIGSPGYVQYLLENYLGERRGHMSLLFDYTIIHYGPVYIWRLFTDSTEHKMWRSRFVQLMLCEPALLEAVFAAASRSMGVTAQPSSDVLLDSLEHYNKALTLLRGRISEPSAAYNDAIFWSIIALLINDQERDDWRSYGVNLRGIRQIIELRGGPESLRSLRDRSYSMYSWAESCYAKHIDPSDPNSPVEPEVSSEAPEFEVHPEKALSSLRQYSPAFFRIAKQLPLACPTICALEMTLRWFGTHPISNGSEFPRDQTRVRASLAKTWHMLLRKSASREMERLVSLGLFALLIGLAPLSMAERYPHVLTRYTLELDGMIVTAAFEDCALWTGLVLASMPLNVGLVPKSRWMILQHVISQMAVKRDWEEIRDIAGQFYMTEALESQWQECWELAASKFS